MQIRKLVTTLALAGSCATGGLVVATPAIAAVAPVSRTATSPNQGDHWETLGTYITHTACELEGEWVLDHEAEFVSTRCLFDSNEDVWVLEGLYDPL